MIVIIENLFSQGICESLVRYFISQKNRGNIRYPSDKTNVAFDIDNNNPTFKKIYSILENTVSKIYDKPYVVDWGQITEWKPGTRLQEHFDFKSPNTVMTSVTYLNDSCVGGRTYIIDDIEVRPKVGRTIFFDGTIYKHGITEVIKGNRYAMPVWYK